MEYLSIAEVAKKWGLSERSVRNYCAEGRVDGARLVGKTWFVPETTERPSRKARVISTDNALLSRLLEEKSVGLKGGIYHKTQVELTYNSNHIEGSKLTAEQTRFIYETNTIGVEGESLNVDDIIETTNHFRCIDYVLETIGESLSAKVIKELHGILKSGTSDSKKSWFVVGDYKKLANEVGDRETTPPEMVESEINKLIDRYNALEKITLQDIVSFHRDFEIIHPFQDGNGRVGRLIMFRECLRNGITPFIIDEEHRLFYYRGLSEWHREHGYLIDTCLSAQDKYKKWLDYFGIPYND